MTSASIEAMPSAVVYDGDEQSLSFTWRQPEPSGTSSNSCASVAVVHMKTSTRWPSSPWAAMAFFMSDMLL